MCFRVNRSLLEYCLKSHCQKLCRGLENPPINKYLILFGFFQTPFIYEKQKSKEALAHMQLILTKKSCLLVKSKYIISRKRESQQWYLVDIVFKLKKRSQFKVILLFEKSTVNGEREKS